ncbi:hypothetical protein I4F81_006551 [Pyropia yezoensis]|uniref:Uncharacterized protein n=1 Tax=Pyropia yezoensis TaxID=2788 RepID=A0ACC3C1J1_PYRYE|nr:hypothetical protein I4F81_006551 [Neopyropia yezoensis]
MPLRLEDVRHAVRNICTYKLASDMLPAMLDVLIQTLSTDELFPGGAVLPATDADDLDCEDNDDDDDIDVLGA